MPTGVTQINVEAWGGGGKGGSRGTSVGSGGGAGGGAYASSLVTVIPGTTYTITVGTGSTSSVLPGGDTWFNNSSTILAKGGNSVLSNSAIGATGGDWNACIGTVRRSGGNGANGGLTFGGGGGSSAVNGSNGTTATTRLGATIVGGGSGGNGRNTSNGNGSPAGVPGGGGGGCLRISSGSSAGGNGGNGRIVITYASPSEINVKGNGNSIVDGDLTPVLTDWTDFGTTSLGLGVTRVYTIENTGFATLYLYNLTITGAGASNFYLTSGFPTNISAGTSATFSITFVPTTNGLKSAMLTFTNSDADESTYNYTIQGTGTTSASQIINVSGNNYTIPQGSTTTLTSNYTNFGATNLNTSISRTFTIKNTGGSDLTLTGVPLVSITGVNAAEFSLSVLPATTLTPGNSTTFQITFSPTTVGVKNAILNISSNHATMSPYNFRISGTSIQAFIDTDNDGIYNNADSDDDNDGIPDVVEQSNASLSSFSGNALVTLLNETFGSGTTRERININIPTATTTYCYEDGLNVMNEYECDASGDLNDGQYTLSNTAQIASWASAYWYTGPDHTSDSNGRMALFNAETDITDEFYRTIIHGVTANAPLTYSFWAINLDRTDAPGIGVEKQTKYYS